MEKIYDVAVIGSGPAGISAAVNLKILNKSFIWLSSRLNSKKTERAEIIKNYIGLPDIGGAELNWTFKNHYEGMNIEPSEEVATGVYETGGKFTVLAGEKAYDCKCVILCVGVEAVKPLKGEEKLVGRGISYCATCDGFLYRDKTIAILCTDKRYEHEVEFLCGLSKKAFVFPMYNGYAIKSEKAEIVLKNPQEVIGEERFEKVLLRGGEIAADGMFILRGAVSPATLVKGLETEEGHIKVDRALRTNIDGIFAAGDCTGRPYQFAKAVGEGNVAAHSAVEYLGK